MSTTKEQQEILNLVSKFGCLDIEQIKVLMEPYEEKTVNLLVNTLIKNHILSVVERNDKTYIVPFGNEKAFDYSQIACVWVMMEMSTSKDEIKEAMKAEAPAAFYFTSNRRESFEIMYVNSDNLFKLNIIQERYKMRSKQKSRALVDNYTILVVGNKENNDKENMEIINTIYNYELEFPFILALLSNTGQGKPTIKKYKGIPKNVQNKN